MDTTGALKRLFLDVVGVLAVPFFAASTAGFGFAAAVSIAGFAVIIINLVLLLSDDRRQTLNDKIAGTVIVKNR